MGEALCEPLALRPTAQVPSGLGPMVLRQPTRWFLSWAEEVGSRASPASPTPAAVLRECAAVVARGAGRRTRPSPPTRARTARRTGREVGARLCQSAHCWALARLQAFRWLAVAGQPVPRRSAASAHPAPPGAAVASRRSEPKPHSPLAPSGLGFPGGLADRCQRCPWERRVVLLALPYRPSVPCGAGPRAARGPLPHPHPHDAHVHP